MAVKKKSKVKPAVKRAKKIIKNKVMKPRNIAVGINCNYCTNEIPQGECCVTKVGTDIHFHITCYAQMNHNNGPELPSETVEAGYDSATDTVETAPASEAVDTSTGQPTTDDWQKQS